MRRRIGIIIGIAIVALIAFRVVSTINSDNEVVEKDNSVTVEALEVGKGTIVDYTYLVGTLEANKVSYVIPNVPAKVEKVFVEVGDEVLKDDVLFELDAKDFEKQVELAELSINSALSSVNQANLSLENANDNVKAAELAYEVALANYDASMEQYDYAKDNLEKYEQLYNDGIVSEAEYEQIKLQASESTVILIEKQLEQAQLSLDQARTAVDNASISSQQANTGLRQSEVSFDQAQDSIDDMMFETTIDGLVTAINIQEGIQASVAEAAVTIEDMDTVKIELSASEKIINRLELGQEVDVFIESIGEEPFVGVLTTVSPSADARTLLYKVVVTIDNEGYSIKPGMFSNVRLKIDEAIDHIIINSSAVLNRDNENYVYIVENNMPKLVKLTTGIDTGAEVEVLEGLNVGDIYLTKGMEFITESTEIKVVRGDQ